MTQSLIPESTIQKLQAIAGLTLREQEPLARHVSMGVGGPARWFGSVESEDALPATLDVLREGGVPWMVLGGGSNTIFSSAGFGGVVLTLGKGFKVLQAGPEPDQITAGAGTPLSAVMNFAKRAGLAGLEWAAGIPGTLGGALAGNAGTRAGEICQYAEAVEVIDALGLRRMRRRGEFTFGYRTSSLSQDIILGATFKLRPEPAEVIQQRINEALAKRGQQPIGVRCSGCTFKNPPGDSAGRLIDLAGLKGMRVGGARVSDEHANFIINEGTATADDLFNLIEMVRGRVQDKFGVELKLEIHIVGLDSQEEIF